MAARLITRRYDRALAPAALSANAYSILARLDREGPLALGALAARLAMERTTLSREIEPLLAAGLVETARAEGDRRKRILGLSDDGIQRVALAHPLWAGAQRELAAEFGEDRIEMLVEELGDLVGAEA